MYIRSVIGNWRFNESCLRGYEDAVRGVGVAASADSRDVVAIRMIGCNRFRKTN